MRWRIALVVVLLAGGLMTPGGGIGTGEIGKDDFPQIPTQSPHTLARVHHTRGVLPGGQPTAAGTALLLRGRQRRPGGRLRDRVPLERRQVARR
jgi:hypothetical protein